MCRLRFSHQSSPVQVVAEFEKLEDGGTGRIYRNEAPEAEGHIPHSLDYNVRATVFLSNLRRHGLTRA